MSCIRIGPVLLVDVGLLDALVLRAPVLEPDLDLRFSESQSLSQLETSAPGNIFAAVILKFQSQGLLVAERRPLPSWPPLFPPTSGHCNQNGSILLIRHPATELQESRRSDRASLCW